MATHKETVHMRIQVCVISLAKKQAREVTYIDTWSTYTINNTYSTLLMLDQNNKYRRFKKRTITPCDAHTLF